jgi:hypothetical protein
MLTRVARTLRPTLAMHEDIEQTTMLLLLRPLVVDLLQAAGASNDEAQAALPTLEVEPETGALRYVEETDDAAEAAAGSAGGGASADGTGAFADGTGDSEVTGASGAEESGVAEDRRD